MRAGLMSAAAAGAFGALVGGCLGPTHPDPARYEYLYINGVFQPPYTSFPSGADRVNWKCYDGKTKKEFDCTFVRGGWEYYQYIYRPRRS